MSRFLCRNKSTISRLECCVDKHTVDNFQYYSSYYMFQALKYIYIYIYIHLTGVVPSLHSSFTVKLNVLW